MIVIVVASYGLFRIQFWQMSLDSRVLQAYGQSHGKPCTNFFTCQAFSSRRETIRHVVRIVTFIMQPFRLKAFPVLFSSLPLLFPEFSTPFSLNSLFVSNAATMSGPAEVGIEASEAAELLKPEFPNFV